MNGDLALTPAGANLIKHFESCLKKHGELYKPYRCPANVLTIGWGSTQITTAKSSMSKHGVDASAMRRGVSRGHGRL